MELYAATVLFALEWYVYPVIILCVAIPMAAVWTIEHRREKRENERRLIFPEPCFTHMGRTVDGRQIWCHDIYGHDGGHTSDWGLTQQEVDEDLSEPGGPDDDLFWPVKEWRAPEPEDHTTFENLRAVRPVAPDRCTGADVAGNQCFYSAGHGGEHYIRSYADPVVSFEESVVSEQETECFRSSNCHMADGHDGPCTLTYP
jgi:hypothetical protein